MKTTQVTRRYAINAIDAASYNPRTIKESAMAGLQESLGAYGLLEMPVVNVHGGACVLISGHQRLTALKSSGFTHVDCMIVDFDPIKEKMANIAMNNTATQGKFDLDRAAPELQKIINKLGNAPIAGFAALMESMSGSIARLEAREEHDDDSKEVTPEDEPDSKQGKIYTLGRHRLWCGPMQEGSPRLFQKRQADCCITDPPYNVAYTSDKGESIDNDDLPQEQWTAMATEWFQTILKRTNGPCVVFYASFVIEATLKAFAAGGGVMSWMGLWVKDIPAVSPLTYHSADYHFQTEPFLVGWRSGVECNVAPCWSILRHPRSRRNQYHPMQKPVPLIRTLVERHAPEGAMVYDPFLGSGSTLIACEESGRVCYGSELSPQHCDRIRQRWVEMVHGADADWQALTPGT